MCAVHAKTQMRKGFVRVEYEMPDIELDFPKAHQLLADYKRRAIQEGWLTGESEDEFREILINP